jgi:hypothetical protein
MVSTKIFRYIQRVEREASKLLELDNTPRVAAEHIWKQNVLYIRIICWQRYGNEVLFRKGTWVNNFVIL